MSEVKTMSSIQFPNTQQPYQVNDARIPADPGAYQQMVTDGNGNWGVADRLAYDEVAQKELFNQNVKFLFDSEVNEGYSEDEIAVDFLFVAGNEYDVVWDGIKYSGLVAFGSDGEVAIGAQYGSWTDELPFTIGTYQRDSGEKVIYFATTSDASSHTISIVGQVKSFKRFPESLMPEGYPYITYEYKPLMENQTATTTKHIYVNAYVANNIANDIPVNVGDAYKVVFNGETYEGIAHSADGGYIYIGNADIDDSGNITHGSGDPFCFQINEGASWNWRLFTDTPGEYTFSVYLKDEVVHPMDSKFLPNPIPAEYLPGTTFQSHGDLADANLDEVTALGYYNLTTSYTYTNTPDSLTNGALLVFSSGASRVQLFMGKAAGSGLYTRRYIGGAWKDWVAYATVADLENASGGGGGKTVVYYAHMGATSDGTDLYRDPDGIENVTCADIDELDLTQDRIYIRELDLNGMDFSVVENSGTYANAFKRFGASGDNPAFWMFLVLYKSSSDPTAEAETLSLYTDGMYSVLR